MILNRICGIALFMLLYGNALADTLTVGKGNTDSIREAISLATPFDVIMVEKGEYKEGNIVIDKPLQLIGIDYPLLDGEKKYEVITIESDSVLISGFHIKDVGKSYTKDWAGIRVAERDHCTIKNNRLVDTFFGIYLEKVEHCHVENNEMITESEDEVNSGNGIHLWDCSNVTIEGNHVAGHRDGIYLEFVENSRISGNISEKNLRYGLHFMFSNYDEYDNNTFRENGTGVAVMFSNHISMTNNRFLENWGSASYGLLFKEIYDGELTGNLFFENTIALYGDGANRIHISGNEFVRNGWAMNMLGNSLDNIITYNNFIGNTFDIATNTKKNNNLFEKNFWDEYTGYDLDNDGIGDVPFRPVKLFSYVIGRVPESIILLRSLFIDMLNYAEKVAPVLTPANLEDKKPLMTKISDD